MANIDNVQLPDGSSYNIVDNTSGFATQNYVDSSVSSVTKATIGLGNVDNTSDLNKPISTATQTALDTLDEDKADKTDIATVESGTTASRAYSAGELVYVSGTLYRVKTAIASGATFTVGTNVEVTNVSNAIGNKGSVSVTADGTKTLSALLGGLYALIDYNKVTPNTKLIHETTNSVMVYSISFISSGGYRFGGSYPNGGITALITRYYQVAPQTSGAGGGYTEINISNNSVNAQSEANSVPANGQKFTIKY